MTITNTNTNTTTQHIPEFNMLSLEFVVTNLQAQVNDYFQQNFQLAIDLLEEGIARNLRAPIIRAFDMLSKWVHISPLVKPFLVRCLSALTVQDMNQGRIYMSIAQEILPDNADILNNLAYVEHHVHRDYIPSMAHYKKCIELHPEYLTAYLGLSDVLHTLRLYDEEEEILRRGLSYMPNEPKLLNQLGVNQVHNLRYNNFQAIDDLFLKALDNATDSETIDSIHLNRGHVLSIQGNYHDAILEYIRAIPDDLSKLKTQIPHQNLLLNIHYVTSRDTELVKAIEEKFNLLIPWTKDNSSPWTALHHRFFKDMFTNSLVPQHHQPKWRAPQHRKLRIGYVASDLYHHAVAMFSDVLFQNYDASIFDVYIYCNRIYNTDIIEKFRCTAFRMIQNIKVDECVDIIKADGIDILIDLSGHTAENRLNVFAKRPVPILLSYIAYPNCSGLEGQIRLTDAFTEGIPEGVPEQGIPHALPPDRWIIPQMFLHFKPREERTLAQVKQWDRYNPDSVVFGCYCKLPKINSTVIHLWSKLLKILPKARLVIKSQMFMDGTLSKKFIAQFPESEQSRVMCLQGSMLEYAGHLDAFKLIDIHLDTFPYSGTTISNESIYMNVPVLTLCPDNSPHVHRVTGSILNTLKLPECIARTEEEYLNKATALVHLAPTLRVRERFDKSIMRNADVFMKNYEATLLDIAAKYVS